MQLKGSQASFVSPGDLDGASSDFQLLRPALRSFLSRGRTMPLQRGQSLFESERSSLYIHNSASATRPPVNTPHATLRRNSAADNIDRRSVLF